MHGISTLEVEISNVSSHGIWLFVKDKEYFLSFVDYPWFKKASIEAISDVKLLHSKHLFWEKLDVDLDIDSIENPTAYPLLDKKYI